MCEPGSERCKDTVDISEDVEEWAETTGLKRIDGLMGGWVDRCQGSFGYAQWSSGQVRNSRDDSRRQSSVDKRVSLLRALRRNFLAFGTEKSFTSSAGCQGYGELYRHPCQQCCLIALISPHQPSSALLIVFHRCISLHRSLNALLTLISTSLGVRNPMATDRGLITGEITPQISPNGCCDSPADAASWTRYYPRGLRNS